MNETKIIQIINKQRSFFNSGITQNIDWRLSQLKSLKKSVQHHQKAIYEALWLDLHKCEEEVFLTEFSIVIKEIDTQIAHLKQWAKPKKKRTPFYLFPSKSFIMYDPLGLALIIAPWNYPLNLTLCPLVGAIASGCCAILKPSPYAVHTSAVIQNIIEDAFNTDYIAVVQGHRDVNKILLSQKFDIIFFTGSPTLGSEVMNAAATHLSKVVLELGGKSPCIVDNDANIEVAARRIAWGKTVNAGQTCIAPDYLFVHSDVKNKLLERINYYFKFFYGSDAQQSNHYCRIINDKAFDRLTSYLNEGEIVFGGKIDKKERYIQPTIIDNVTKEMKIMNDEIFGPILPVITFINIEEVCNYIIDRPKPLALYYFGSRKRAEYVLDYTSSGGAAINDVLMHIANHNLPFGGVNNSGLGKYHGKESFLAFSHTRSVLVSSPKIDIKMKFPPYKNFKIIKKFL